MRTRFAIQRVVVVCDRGMVAETTLAKLATAGFDDIVGMKMRDVLEVRAEVLRRAGRYHVVRDNLHVKEVRVDDRYVVCFNPEEAAKDRQDRDDARRVREEARYDGKYVLRITTSSRACSKRGRSTITG